MSRCLRCKIEILDDSVMCPLCHGVLSKNDDESVKSSYPMVGLEQKKLYWVLKITIFLSVLAEMICILINYLTYSRVKWSLVTGVTLGYLCFTMMYSLKRNKSHQRKMIMQLIVGLVIVFAIDMILGDLGWSVKYVIPASIVLMGIGVAVLMLVNKNMWQSYLMAQIWLIIISMACIVIEWFFIGSVPLFNFIAAAFSLLMFSTSIVFGDKSAINELHRRFHI